MKQLYGLIGLTLSHSFSRDFFNRKFAAEDINAEYINIELPDIGDFIEAIAEMPNLCGLNVTIPYKEAIIPYLTKVSDNAREIGAVNTIAVEYDDRDGIILTGHNTDVVGFVDSVEPLLKPGMNHALVLGTGGASKAIVHGLRSLDITTTLVSRKAGEGHITYADLTEEVMERNKIVVNTTPLGMWPDVDSSPNIPYSLLTPDHLCYDLVYNPDMTLFLRKASERGASVKNGLEMLLLQAYAAWKIWQESNAPSKIAATI
ncbi:MAG: shikimate dehydrogenase [Pseudoflavonifractor sp.]|nr:shikimate dehydrogenase [Alloprevotella sp.]MCM1117235.1 shikimate dehydrogenase [Pseudoflavonifractor sp.]